MPPCLHRLSLIRSVGCCGGSIAVFGCNSPENGRFVCVANPTEKFPEIPACYLCAWRKEPAARPQQGNFNDGPVVMSRVAVGAPQLNQTRVKGNHSARKPAT